MSLPFFFEGQARDQYLVGFRAGKMTQNGTTVSPVKGRKGLVFLHSPGDSLIHFCWKDRETGVTEDDLIIFPREAEFKKVSQCITGRVFVLKFKFNDRRLFYWSQEPKEDKDKQWIITFNNYMNNQRFLNYLNINSLTGCLPPSTGATEFRGGVRRTRPKVPIEYVSEEPNPYSRLSNRFDRLYRQSLNDSHIRSVTEQMLVPAPESTDTDLDPDYFDFIDFNEMPALEYLGPFPFESENIETLTDGSHDSDDCLTIPKDEDLNVALSSALTIDFLQPILSNKRFLRKVRIFLPPSADGITKSEMGRSGRTIQELAATIESNQFKEAVTEFASALQSGNLGHLMSNYGFGGQCMNAVESGDLIGFMEELQKQLFKDNTQFKD